MGEHYLKARDGGFFVKTGTNSPENFLAYAGFDDVQDNGGVGIIHQYAPHRTDWRAGDPYFLSSSTGIDSKGIIGSLNYLGEQGVNAIYFLPMNLGGDGQDTCPFIGYSKTDTTRRTTTSVASTSGTRFSTTHRSRASSFISSSPRPRSATRTGSTTGRWASSGSSSSASSRRGFGYLNGLKWNLSEENDYPVSVLKQMAAYLNVVDPYGHVTSVHTHPNDVAIYEALYGDPLFDAASVQYLPQSANEMTHLVRGLSSASGRKWIIDMDENGMWDVGLSGSNATEMRQEVLYDVLFSNGGIEWYCGYHPLPLGGDVRIENFRTREEMWRYSRIAREFLEDHFNLARAPPWRPPRSDGRLRVRWRGDLPGAPSPDGHLPPARPDRAHGRPAHHLHGVYSVGWFSENG